MTTIPEPAFDLAAQITAMFDGNHPKRAVFFAPGNERQIPSPISRELLISRADGTLLSLDANCRSLFETHGPDDALMAWILGYPQDKKEVVAECRGEPAHIAARSVQARDAKGAVVTEAFVSPLMLDEAKRQLSVYVPLGGGLVVLTPVEAIQRRLLLREMEAN